MKPFTAADISLLADQIAAGVIPDDRLQLLKDLTDQAPSTTIYNHFLYEFVRRYQPESILETGTDRGRSAAHLALGYTECKVVTIDIDPACKENVDALRLENIESVIVPDSLEHASNVPDGSIDVCFLDSLHTPEHTLAEWSAFQPKVKAGGIVFIDDIELDGHMRRFWDDLEGEKLYLLALHSSGFGAVLL